MTKRIKLYQTRTTDGEQKMLEALCNKFGGISAAETIRTCIRDRYRKEFPIYIMERQKAVSPAVEELTQEQICEAAGGKIVMKEGIEKCDLTLPNSRTIYSIPLSDSAQIKAVSKQFKIT